MLLLTSTSDKIQVVSGQAVTTDVHASFVDMDTSGNVTPGRKNTAISTAATADAAGSPAASTTRNVKTLNIRNRHASSSVDVTVQHYDGAITAELYKITLAAGESLIYVEGVGFSKLGATSAVPGGLSSLPSADQTLTASTANVIGGSLFQLPTANLKVGSRFRWVLNLAKTAAGTATWTVAIKYGTAGTNADAAIATWTSNTNTAAIDQANLTIEAAVVSLGAAATANCVAFYSNTLTNITGLGNIPHIPPSTATFDSTAANPFLHVDVTPGASAVMTAVASAERLA